MSEQQRGNVIDAWLTADEAAAYAKTSVATIRRECAAHRLRHARVGGRKAIRIRRSWVDEFLESSSTPVELTRR